MRSSSRFALASGHIDPVDLEGQPPPDGRIDRTAVLAPARHHFVFQNTGQWPALASRDGVVQNPSDWSAMTDLPSGDTANGPVMPSVEMARGLPPSINKRLLFRTRFCSYRRARWPRSRPTKRRLRPSELNASNFHSASSPRSRRSGSSSARPRRRERADSRRFSRTQAAHFALGKRASAVPSVTLTAADPSTLRTYELPPGPAASPYSLKRTALPSTEISAASLPESHPRSRSFVSAAGRHHTSVNTFPVVRRIRPS